jgi:protein O-GlcNAc transferase
MVDEGVTIDTEKTLVPTFFHLAYQGKNDLAIAENFARIVKGPSESRFTSTRVREPANRIRVGFLSAYFRGHTIGRLNLGRVQGLDREQFEVIVLYAGSQHDEMVEKFRVAADQWVSVPRSIEDARSMIRDTDLDVLVFADVGMDALTSTLAHSRMAPVQCATWGHPSTTGSGEIDYFLSSQLLETPHAAEQYSEELARLPLLGVHYDRPVLGRCIRSREQFGLDPTSHLYLCPQTIFKFHPDFDAAIEGVLTKDPNGKLVVIEGRSSIWTERLSTRWKQTLGDAHARVQWIPPQPHEDFLSLLRCADVILDPLHFGGGNTTYEAMAMGVPVVSLPGNFLRNRITAAIYEKMGLKACLVETIDEYVQLAVRIASDKSFASQLRAEIAAKSHRLFNDADETSCFGEFLSRVASTNSLASSHTVATNLQ